MILSPPHLQDGARWAGLRVGLLGGSFNPPHEGHLHAALVALDSLKLDAIWWMVTPQNPLKNKTEMPFEERFALCQAMVNHPQIIVTDIEAHLGTYLTWQTIERLRHAFPKADFVWVTGMDNALTMHRWHNWRYILDNVATAHVARPPAWTIIESCPLKQLRTQTHKFLDSAEKAPLLPRHTYWLMQKKMMPVSSTEIRNQRKKTSG